MTAYAGMIRGVNVGGHNMLRMDDVRAVCASMSLNEARTYLQSGNVVFRSARKDAGRLARDIEEGLRKLAGVDVKVFLRTAAEMRAVIAGNPFPVGPKRDPSHLVVMFLASEPAAEGKAAVVKANAGPEEVHFAGRELYIYYSAGMGRSKLSGTLIERKIGAAGTARNWNTVTKLLELVEDLNQ